MDDLSGIVWERWMHHGPGRTLSIVHLASTPHQVTEKNTDGFFLSCMIVTANLFAFPFLYWNILFQQRNPWGLVSDWFSKHSKNLSYSLISTRSLYNEMKLTLLIFFPQLLMNKQIGLKRYEVDGRKVLFYFDEVMILFLIILLLFSERQMTSESGIDTYWCWWSLTDEVYHAALTGSLLEPLLREVGVVVLVGNQSIIEASD